MSQTRMSQNDKIASQMDDNNTLWRGNLEMHRA